MTRFDPHCRPGGTRNLLNPYRIGLSILVRRLLWDLSPTLWGQRRRIEALRNKYRGKRAVILCNGPSLNDIDLSSIGNIFTFGLNKINLLFQKTDFRPSCIVAVNPFVINQNSEFFTSTDIPLFLDRYASKYGIAKRKDVYLLDSCDFPYFARDCSMSVFQGFTVTYIALQLAYHMGFDRVALVGCDHDYPNEGIPNAVTYNESEDKAHFCRDYFSTEEPWQLPDLRASEHYYDMARRCYEFDGRSVVNASTKTRLAIFPRQTLSEFINDDS
jgi:hypothetical protein